MPSNDKVNSVASTAKDTTESGFDPLSYTDKHEVETSTILCEELVVKTASDEKTHGYFTKFEMNYDVDFAVAPASLFCAKTNDDIVNYWANNNDYVTVYSGYIDENNDNKLIEVFYGKISMVKQRGYKLEIQIDNIGRRFKQKIPEEFRNAYIYNQNVRDAFQAICEFIGVHFVCPPHLDVDESESTGTDSTSGANTATDNIATENGIASNAAKTAQTATNTISKGNTLINSGSNNNTDNTNSEDTENTSEAASEDQISEQVGYKGISFDSSGAICKAESKIEENPDTIQQTTALTDLPFNLYAKEYEEYLKEKQRLEEAQEDSNGDNITETGTNMVNILKGFTGTLKAESVMSTAKSTVKSGNSSSKTDSNSKNSSNKSNKNSSGNDAQSVEQKAEDVTQNEKEPEYPSVEDIKADVLQYLRGENFDELHDEIMDYDAITITPKTSGDTASTTTPTTTDATGATDATGTNTGTNTNSTGNSTNTNQTNK